jgi:hypothetical protein
VTTSADDSSIRSGIDPDPPVACINGVPTAELPKTSTTSSARSSPTARPAAA